MPQVTVTIAGRSYRMACGEGEEAHLEALAASYESKIQELRGSVGELGDMRLHVMAALTLADELSDTRKRAGALEAELASLRGSAQPPAGDRDARVAEAVTKAADRIERLARRLQAPAREEG